MTAFILSILFSYIAALLAMAFYTLLERKALAYFQLRKGPNKVSLMGLPQPFADALKLFFKESSKPTLANQSSFFMGPIFSLTLALILWILYPHSHPSFFFSFGILFFLCISSLNVYTTLASGWSSNSKYALLGALRSIAQTISYEISMALLILSPLIIIQSFNLYYFSTNQFSWIFLMSPPIFFMWFVTSLAETNRTPFDFAEGESELVSGFNVEFSSGMFALIFMAEYTSILIISIISIVLFSGCSFFQPFSDPFLTMKAMSLMFLFIWIRGTLPRMRYDRLMALTWKCFLPLSISYLLLFTTLCSLLF
nr:NADH dehydrogenase subunit 1 [Travisia sanrikuensis]